MKIGIFLMTALMAVSFSGCGIFNYRPVAVKQQAINEAYDVSTFVLEFTEDETLNRAIMDTLALYGYEQLDKCDCTPQLILYGPKEGSFPGLDPVERAKNAVANVRDVEGDVNVALNINVDVTPPRNPRIFVDNTKRNFLTWLLGVFSPKPSLTLAARTRVPNLPDGANRTINIGIVDYFTNVDVAVPHQDVIIVNGDGVPFVQQSRVTSVSDYNHGAKVIAASLKSYQGLTGNFKVIFTNRSAFENEQGSLFKGICAIRHNVNEGLDAINISWGFYENKNTGNIEEDNAKKATIDFFKRIIKEANDAKIPLIAAAGNNRIDIDQRAFYPASFASEFDYVIGVGANDFLWGSKNYYSNYGPENIKTTASGILSFPNQDLPFSGTSYAAPRVSIHAALLRNKWKSDRSNGDDDYKESIMLLKTGKSSWVDYLAPAANAGLE